jgi:hypothetical protein
MDAEPAMDVPMMPTFQIINPRIRTITATGSTTVHDDVVFCNNSSDITLTLHAAASAVRAITIKKIGNNTNIVTIDGNASESIDGETTMILFVRHDVITIVSDGSNWQIVADGRFKHVCKIRRAAAQAIADVTVVQIQFDTTDIDVTGTMANLGSYRVDIKRTGNYNVEFFGRLSGIDDGEFLQVRIHKNNTGGSAPDKFNHFYSPAASVAAVIAASAILPLTAGDYITGAMVHTEGASVNTDTGGIGDMPQLTVSEI